MNKQNEIGIVGLGVIGCNLLLHERTGRRLADVIPDEVRQKGTAIWAPQDAMELQAPVPNITMVVMMRQLSTLKSERLVASRALYGPDYTFEQERASFLKKLRNATISALIPTSA